MYIVFFYKCLLVIILSVRSKKLSFMTSSHIFPAYMKPNAVPKAASAGDQLASRNPAPVAPPVQQTPVVKQVIHCIQIGQLNSF